jgi:succinylglutamic semialdehyde dehydrogenase
MSEKLQTTEMISHAVIAQLRWSRTSHEDRKQVVRRFAEYVATHRETLTNLIMDEVGKLRTDASSEVAAVIAKAEITIEMMDARRADRDDESSAFVSQLRYRPLGVVIVLGPFNFPAHLPGGHIIPALLAGNSVVFKPSELAPRVGQWIGDAWQEAGLPTGVLQVIQGTAAVAKALIDDQQIAAVFFTGGYHAGLSIHRQLAGRPEVLLALEMGGNNPLVLLPPYDLSEAVKIIATSAFASSGQRCTCTRRLILIDDESSQAIITQLVDHVTNMSCGLPHDTPEVAIGPVISAKAAERLLNVQERWLKSGGTPLVQMKRSPRVDALVTPGIIDMTECNNIADDEWFGPLLQVYRVGDFADAIERANATAYGLAAGLIGGSEVDFEEFRRSVKAGIVNWNTSTTGASSKLPFGGLGWSGNHRAAGAFAIDFCNDPIASLMKNP